jgi:hypothetical protein
MPGGLIQLITVGAEDAPLIYNPEITFFKNVYRMHTNFSLEQIIKNLGQKKFNTQGQYTIEKITDLLGGLQFIIDIPYFNILKKVIDISNNTTPINVNEISVIYSNVKTFLYFEAISNKYYLIPENYFILSEHDNTFNNVSGLDLEQVLFKNEEYITSQDYGNSIEVLKMKQSNINQILPVLRLSFNNWSEFWLKIIDKLDDFTYYAKITSQLNLVKQKREKIENILYESYPDYFIFSENREYKRYPNEIRQYIQTELNDNQIESLYYDVDYAIDYAKNNNLEVNEYKLNALKYNSRFLLYLLQNLYPDFSQKQLNFTFWKKYNLGTDNQVLSTEDFYNDNSEWLNRFNTYNFSSLGDVEEINLQIYREFFNLYIDCEKAIKLLYTKLTINKPEYVWSVLKTMYDNYKTDKINFNDFYDLSSNLLNDKIKETFNNYPSLVKNESVSINNFDDSIYIQPMEMSLAYPYLCYKYVEKIHNDNLFDNLHFMVLWRNKINIAYFYKIAETLNNYEKIETTDTLQNVFYNLFDFGKPNVDYLTFYNNINLTKDLRLDLLRTELINLFSSTSFIGSVSCNQNEFNEIKQNKISLNEINPGYNYDISLNEMKIIETHTVNVIPGKYNILEIDNWNKLHYNKVSINTDGITTSEIIQNKFKNGIFFNKKTLYISFTNKQLNQTTDYDNGKLFEINDNILSDYVNGKFIGIQAESRMPFANPYNIQNNFNCSQVLKIMTPNTYGSLSNFDFIYAEGITSNKFHLFIYFDEDEMRVYFYLYDNNLDEVKIYNTAGNGFIQNPNLGSNRIEKNYLTLRNSLSEYTRAVFGTSILDTNKFYRGIYHKILLYDGNVLNKHTQIISENELSLNTYESNIYNFINRSNVNGYNIRVIGDNKIVKTDLDIRMTTDTTTSFLSIYGVINDTNNDELTDYYLNIKDFNFKNNKLILNFLDETEIVSDNIILKLEKHINVPSIYYDISSVVYPSMPINEYIFYEINNNEITTDFIEDNQYSKYIDTSTNYFYQLSIDYLDNTNVKVNIELLKDTNTIYFESDIVINKSLIQKITLLEYDFNFRLITSVQDVINNELIFSNVLTLDNSKSYWLIASKYLGETIPKTKFLPIKYSNNKLIIMGDYDDNYDWLLYENDNLRIPNFFSILDYKTNPNLQMNDFIYQTPLIFNTLSTPYNYINEPIKNTIGQTLYFYNIPVDINTSEIYLNDYKVNFISPILSNQMYRDISTNERISVIFDSTLLNNWDNNILNKSINIFNETFNNDENFSSIINTIEQSTELYINTITNGINRLISLGNTINSIYNNVYIFNLQSNLNFINNKLFLYNYGPFDFNKYSNFSPKYYFNNDFLFSFNKFNINNKGLLLKNPYLSYEPKYKINQLITN